MKKKKLGRWVICLIVPATQGIILKIDRFQEIETQPTSWQYLLISYLGYNSRDDTETRLSLSQRLRSVVRLIICVPVLSGII